MLICWPYLLHMAAACQTPWACWRGPCLLPRLLHGGRSLIECSRLYMHCTAPIQSLTKSHIHLAHTTDLRAAALQRRQATLWTLRLTLYATLLSPPYGVPSVRVCSERATSQIEDCRSASTKGTKKVSPPASGWCNAGGDTYLCPL